jgi:deazaflavin-dependent oxidoreductase (nitroreductase family)
LKDSSVKRWSAVHSFLYRLTRGLVGRRLADNDILLLTTTGHRSGEEHTVPLLYLHDGDRYVVIASYGGRPHHPTWYENLLAHPEVAVQIRSRRRSMLARTATPEERERWWPQVVAAYQGYADYQSRTGRKIPIVFLESVEKG